MCTSGGHTFLRTPKFRASLVRTNDCVSHSNEHYRTKLILKYVHSEIFNVKYAIYIKKCQNKKNGHKTHLSLEACDTFTVITSRRYMLSRLIYTKYNV